VQNRTVLTTPKSRQIREVTETLSFISLGFSFSFRTATAH
jgi:hypothetical protein